MVGSQVIWTRSPSFATGEGFCRFARGAWQTIINLRPVKLKCYCQVPTCTCPGPIQQHYISLYSSTVWSGSQIVAIFHSDSFLWYPQARDLRVRENVYQPPPPHPPPHPPPSPTLPPHPRPSTITWKRKRSSNSNEGWYIQCMSCVGGVCDSVESSWIRHRLVSQPTFALPLNSPFLLPERGPVCQLFWKTDKFGKLLP